MKHTTEKALEIFKAELDTVRGDNQRMKDYCMKTAFGLVELENGEVLEYDRAEIKTRFCFGYSDFGQGPDYETATENRKRAETQATYFLRENLEDLENEIKEIEEAQKKGYRETDYRIPVLVTHYTRGEKLKEFNFKRSEDVESERGKAQGYRRATEKELEAIKQAKLIKLEDLKKRLSTYLKRYGLSKLSTWTYRLDE